ncbi:MAG: hypothetical protein JWR63_3878 [Conexibacter sp.]|nr:hypothetical protein [Conexibacter sp.]
MSAPLVSLLLPAFDAPAVTLRCLEALARLPAEPPFELVVVVDALDADARSLVAGLEGSVRVLLEHEPTGAGDAFDTAAAAATAPVLVLLTAAAVPADGWLDDLLAALAAPGDVAALPRSIAPDGADLPEASWLALAVAREVYAAVGGFAATRAAGRAEKATLVEALRGAGAVADARSAVLLAGA